MGRGLVLVSLLNELEVYEVVLMLHWNAKSPEVMAYLLFVLLP